MRKLFPILFMLLSSMTVMAQDNVNLCPDDKHPHAIDFYPDRWELGDGIRNNALTVRPIRP